MRPTQDEDGSGMITVRALGASEIRIGRKRLPVSAEVVFALGLYLCTRAGERLTRDELCEVFWGDGRDALGRHSLRQMLYRLRRHGLTLDENGEELYLDPARVDSDLNEALQESWVNTAEAAAIEAASSLTPGFTRHISERFQEWFDGVRHRLAAQHRRASLRQISLARREGRWADLDTWALQILTTDPLNEEATLARAESAAMAGSKTVALEIIDAYMEELGERANVIGLPASVLRRRIAERKVEWVDKRPLEVPFVGRHELMSRLTEQVDASARANGSSILLWGAPGIGKTRISEEVQAYADLAGFTVVCTRATVAHASRPLSVLLALIPLLRSLPGAAGCDPATLGLLDRVSRTSVERPDFNPAATIASLREALIASFQDLLDALAEESPLLIVIDDLHNADSASKDILRSLFAHTSTHSVIWIATSRSSQRDVMGDSSTPDVLTSLYVPPLEIGDATVLAEAIANTQRSPLDFDECTTVAIAGGGNPLFVRELSVHRSTHGATHALPSSLLQLIRERLQHMSAPTLRLLRVTTLLGSLATPARVRALMGRHASDMVTLIEELEVEGVLYLSSSHTLDLHECWQQVVAEQMSAAPRAALSLECAHLLCAPDETPQRAEVAWRAAMLYADAGENARALELYHWYGHEMLERGLPSEASDIFERALQLARTDSERHMLLTSLARAQHSRGLLADVVAIVDRALNLSPTSASRGTLEYATLLTLRCESLAKLHRDHRSDLAALAELASNASLPPEARQSVCLLGIGLVYADTTSPLERFFFDTSISTTEEAGVSTAGCLVSLIYFAEQGNEAEVRRVNSLLESLEGEKIPAALRCRALRYRTSALRFVGDTATVESLAERAIELSIRSGVVSEAVRTAEAMAFARLDAEDHDGALQWIERWNDLASSPGNPQEKQAMTHLRGRRYAQLGEYEKALAVYSSRFELTSRDLLQKRRAVDLATIAVSMAGVGDIEKGRQILFSLKEIIEANRASFQLDYIVEMCLRAFVLTGDRAICQTWASAYLERRAREFGAPLRRFSRALNAATTVMPS